MQRNQCPEVIFICDYRSNIVLLEQTIINVHTMKVQKV